MQEIIDALKTAAKALDDHWDEIPEMSGHRKSAMLDILLLQADKLEAILEARGKGEA